MCTLEGSSTGPNLILWWISLLGWTLLLKRIFVVVVVVVVVLLAAYE